MRALINTGDMRIEKPVQSAFLFELNIYLHENPVLGTEHYELYNTLISTMLSSNVVCIC